MFTSGDDAGHCSNGLTAQKFRDSTPEERAVYRKWLRGMVLVYGTLLLMSGVAAHQLEDQGATRSCRGSMALAFALLSRFLPVSA